MVDDWGDTMQKEEEDREGWVKKMEMLSLGERGFGSLNIFFRK